MTITGTYKTALLAAAISAALAGCGGSGSDTVSGKTGNPPKYYIYATDHEGYVNIFSDDGVATVELVNDFLPQNCGAAVALGEVHFTEHKALVVIQSGLKNAACDTETGGGLAVVDLHDQTIEIIKPLIRDDGKASRIVHTYMDPAGTHLWLNDDGAKILVNDVLTDDPAPDYVFRVNVNSEDMNGDGDDYLNITPIPVGDGHKKSAFSHMSDTAMAGDYFATHNSRSRTVSIIDNNSASATFLQVVQTVDLAANDSAHGMDFSPTSGHFYTGLTSGSTNAVNIIDATGATLPLPTDNIVANTGDNPIPAAGYVHTHGDKVYTVGYVPGLTAEDPGTGYFSIINAADDTVAQVIPIGDVSASSFNISHMEMDHGGGNIMVEMKAWIPGTSKGGEKNVVKVLTLDHMTGLHDGNPVRTVTVGVGTDHRNGKITPDGMHAIFPNGGECTPDHHQNVNTSCMTISVIDTSTETVISTVYTAGHTPAGIGVVSAAGVGAGGGGGGHTH